MAGPDFVNTLKPDQVKEVVYAAEAKPYMRAYLEILGVLQNKGFGVEPTLNYVAQQVTKNLIVYGIASERLRNAPSRGSGLLLHTQLSQDESGELVDTIFECSERDKKTGLVYVLEGDKKIVKHMFPIGLIEDLQEYESKLLQPVE